jgi:hypothetical protein
MPRLEIHTVESAEEPAPLNYSKSQIQLLEDNTSHDVTPLDVKTSTETKELREEIAALKFDLSQEKEEKQDCLMQVNQQNNKIKDLEDLVGHLREMQEKYGALPLNSFDASPRAARHERAERNKEPSLLDILVGNQAAP